MGRKTGKLPSISLHCSTGNAANSQKNLGPSQCLNPEMSRSNYFGKGWGIIFTEKVFHEKVFEEKTSYKER